MNDIEFTIVDPDLYLPIERLAEGTGYVPQRTPPDWLRRDSGPWTYWTPAEHAVPAQGWKVHVSARLARAQHVLDVVAEVCGEHGVPFKHVRTDRLFLWLHHKHGPRTQSGKFCTAYPADPRAARSLMAALDAALPGESGPYVLTDRRFGESSVVSYRYGSFTPRFRTQPDGTRVPVLTGADGAEVLDDRQPRFVLPAGMADPFAEPPEALGAGPVSVNGYTFAAVLQFSNAGGAYRATAPDGCSVFVKEARKDNGYQWDGTTAMQRLRREHATLRLLHAAEPGLCPAPADYFGHWEHEFLVTELVPGVPLNVWTSQHNPLVKAGATDAMFLAYYDRCRALLGALRDQVRRLHAAGYAFVDLNPRNVLVDEDDRPRLIDFEEAQPLGEPRPVHGAEGFLAPRALRREGDTAYLDEYGLAACAQLLLHPAGGVLDRHQAAAAHLLAGLPVVPADLWHDATRFRPADPVSAVPGPEDVAKAPEEWVDWLAERVAAGLESMCDPSATVPYPLGPAAHATNAHCLAYGTAGVVYALHRAGAPVDGRVVRGLLDTVLAGIDDLPPGLLVGTAGLAWLFADLGDLDAARDLLAASDRYPLDGRDSTLAHGSAGVALAHLALAGRDGDPDHLSRAADLLACVPDGDALVPTLGPDERTGWLAGRPGLALALHYLALLTGDADAVRRGRALLLADLAQSYRDGDGLQFHISRTDRRVEPYLASGSAGFALVAGRYLAGADDAEDPLSVAYRRCLTSVRGGLLPVLPSLFQGLAGMGLVLSDLASFTGSPALRADALRGGRALFAYTVPRGGGICFLGPGNRFSADLADGTAGVLLFLGQLRDGRPNALFTLDSLPDPGTPAAGAAHRRTP